MTRYELWLFLHIVAAIIWIGAGFLLQVLGLRADRARDDASLRKVLDDVHGLANVLFIPASLSVLIFGLLLVFDGPWSFEELWITLGLVGYAATFVTGLAVISPRAKRIGQIMERERGFGPTAAAETKKLLVISRIDLVVLFLVVADMVLKPRGEDVGTLVVMAAVLVAGVAWSLWRARSIEPRPAPAA